MLCISSRWISGEPRHRWRSGYPSRPPNPTRLSRAAPGDRLRASRDALYRFISAMAGNEPGFEEAARALFAGDKHKFEILAGGWPADIGNHAKRLAARAFQG